MHDRCVLGQVAFSMNSAGEPLSFSWVFSSQREEKRLEERVRREREENKSTIPRITLYSRVKEEETFRSTCHLLHT